MVITLTDRPHLGEVCGVWGMWVCGFRYVMLHVCTSTSMNKTEYLNCDGGLDWIVFFVLYLFCIGFFVLICGFGFVDFGSMMMHHFIIYCVHIYR